MNSKFYAWRVFSKVKGSFYATFHIKILILSPLEFFENENFNARAPVRAARASIKTLVFKF